MVPLCYRLNKSPPNISFKKKERGGINLSCVVSSVGCVFSIIVELELTVGLWPFSDQFCLIARTYLLYISIGEASDNVPTF